jgi:4-hydroxy-3-methylbut-2-enyl diphosphate reductase
LKVFDATCPLVTKVHLAVARHAHDRREVVLIGHRGHPEVEGTLGQYDPRAGGAIYLVETTADVADLAVLNPDNLSFVTQTTLSVDDAARIIDLLRQRFPNIQGPRKDDICYATQNRQDAVKELAARCDVVLVVGSPNSSNSNRLREIASGKGSVAYLVDGPAEIDPAWITGATRVGVTAGASAPEVLVSGVIEALRGWGGTPAQETNGRIEEVVFPLPRTLQENAVEDT